MKSALLHLILSIIFCAVAIIGYSVWYAVISAKSIAVTNVQNSIDAKSQAITTAKLTRTTFAKIESDEAIVQGYFVSETDIVSFINELETSGRTQGTVVNVLSVAPDKKSAVPALVLMLSVRGTFDAVLRTVGSIEYAPHNIAIAALSLGKDDEKNSWRADITLWVGTHASSTPTKKP